MRINKYLARQGLASRRQIDKLIVEQRILVNGVPAKPGQRLQFGDTIKLGSQTYVYNEERPPQIYIALYKPRGISSSCSPKDPSNIISYLREKARKSSQLLSSEAYDNLDTRFYPVGRLDKESEGLMLLTNDGDLAQRLTHPSFEHEKEYLVYLEDELDRASLEAFASGLEIESKDGTRVKTRAAKVSKENSKAFRIILKQGLNRQIRRMAEARSHRVSRLIRLRIAKLKLDRLQEGEFRLINLDDII